MGRLLAAGSDVEGALLGNCGIFLAAALVKR